MNRIQLLGNYYLIPDAWDVVKVGDYVLRRRHAAAFSVVTSRGKEFTIPTEIVTRFPNTNHWS